MRASGDAFQAASVAAGGNNAHGLDRDKDGNACESLPGAP